MATVWVVKGKGVGGPGAMASIFAKERTWGPFNSEEEAEKWLQERRDAHSGTRRHFSGRVEKKES